MKKKFLLISVFCLIGTIGVFASNLKSDNSRSIVNSTVEGATLVVTASHPNPGNESIDKIHDGNPNTKWIAGNSAVWVQYKYSEAKTWRKYVIISGNDAPERDPKDWTLSASNDSVTWVTLNTRSNEVWADRNQAQTYEFANDNAYKYYYLDITANNGADKIQFSELIFSCGNDTQAPTAPIGLAATSIRSNSFVLRWKPATDDEVIASYKVYLEGSLIGTTYASDILFKVEYLDPTTKYSFTVKAIDFSGNVSAESAPLEVTTAVDPQLNVTASGENLPNEGIDKLYDDILGDKWLVFEPTAWVIYQYGVAQKWDSYAVTSGNDGPDRDPLDWTIEGSTDGVNWTLLDTQTGQSWGERNQTKDYSIANAAVYNYYKWDITANNGAPLIQVSELTYSLNSSVAGPILVVTASHPNPGNESIDNIHDGNPNTKWIAESSTVWVQYKYSDAKTWRKYVIISGNDVPERDPKDWTLKASNDSVSWVTLDTRSNEVWADRKQAQTYEFANEIAYKYYYLEITANNGADKIQFSELIFSSGNDTQAPTAPTGLTAESIRFSSFILHWEPATDDEVIASYKVYLEGSLIGTTYASDTLYKVEYLDATTKYSFTVKAIDFSGNVSAESAPFEVTTAVDPQLVVTASGENLPNEGIDKLYDDILGDKWLVFEPTAWVIYQYGVAQKWDSYAITSGNDGPDRDPNAWTIEGSTDGENWTVLDTQSGQTWDGRNETKNYSIANAAVYNYYKWDITANNGSSDLIQVSELTYSLITATSAIKTKISDIRVYPNPSNGIINIEAKQAQNSTVTVYDANGRVLLSKNINNEVERIDLSAFKGLLLVKVAGEGVVTTKKIIIK